MQFLCILKSYNMINHWTERNFKQMLRNDAKLTWQKKTIDLDESWSFLNTTWIYIYIEKKHGDALDVFSFWISITKSYTLKKNRSKQCYYIKPVNSHVTKSTLLYKHDSWTPFNLFDQSGYKIVRSNNGLLHFNLYSCRFSGTFSNGNIAVAIKYRRCRNWKSRVLRGV